MFGTTLPSRDWDLMLFTWVGSPSSSITAKDIYGCGGDQNDGAYCNRALTKVLQKVSTTLDAGRAGEAAQQRRGEVHGQGRSVDSDVRPAAVRDQRRQGEGACRSTRRRRARPGTSPSGRPRNTRSRRLTETRRPASAPGGGGTSSLGSRTEPAVLTYIIRRLLYSVVVLLAGELPHLHVRDGLGRPAGGPEDLARRLRRTVQNVIERKHLDDPIPCGTSTGSRTRHEPVRHDAARRPADPAGPLARDEEHAAARARGASCSRSSSPC